MRIRLAILSNIVFALTTGFPLHAQNTAELRGAVIDSTGAVLPGVALTLVNKGNGQDRNQLTDANGSYVFASLANGEYVLRAELSGFRTQIWDGISLQ